MELSRHVLGPTSPTRASSSRATARRSSYFEFGDTGEAVAFLGEALRGLMHREPNASVALITRYPQQADVYYEALRIAEVPRAAPGAARGLLVHGPASTSPTCAR